MIIECPHCESKVDGKVLAELESYGYGADDLFPAKISLLACPVCKEAILAGQELIQTGPNAIEWTRALRL